VALEVGHVVDGGIGRKQFLSSAVAAIAQHHFQEADLERFAEIEHAKSMRGDASLWGSLNRQQRMASCHGSGDSPEERNRLDAIGRRQRQVSLSANRAAAPKDMKIAPL
jgi:hypothetical protein